jgi:hypothetical protein
LFKKKKRGRENKIVKKVVKISYKDLYDGVHPNDNLRNKWFYFMCLSINNSFQFVNEEQDDSDSDSDHSWDFKRV